MTVDDKNFFQGRRPSAFSDLLFAMALACPATFSVTVSSVKEMAQMILRILAKSTQLPDL